VALSTAPRAELESATASLASLHRRLGDLLGIRTPPEGATGAPGEGQD
jgi:hypothetical protein